MSFSFVHRLVALLALVLVLVGAGCSGETNSSSPRELVGAVDGTDVLIGVVVEADHAVAYLCDGTETGAAVSTWLEGPASASGLDLNASGVRVQGTLSAGGLTGTVLLPDGTSRTFAASSAMAPAGLYRDSSSYDGALGGWVVLADGRLRGALRVEGGGVLPATGSVTTGGVVSSTSGNFVLTGVRVVTSRPSKPPAAGSSTGCTAATTCNGRGLCSAAGTCACNTGFSGATCNACATGFFGFPACKFCSAGTTCSGRGTCDATGGCACNSGFTGAACTACAADFYGFPTCTFCSAATTCNGNGVCSATGQCTCNAGFSGPSCK